MTDRLPGWERHGGCPEAPHPHHVWLRDEPAAYSILVQWDDDWVFPRFLLFFFTADDRLIGVDDWA